MPRQTLAVHALFLAHYPQALQFEEFIYPDTALDAYFMMMNPA